MKEETFDEKTGRVTVMAGKFCYVVDGYDADSVDCYNNSLRLPQFVRSYTLPTDKVRETEDLIYARWEMLSEMATRLARRN